MWRDDPNSRQKTIQEIIDRATSDEDWAQVSVLSFLRRIPLLLEIKLIINITLESLKELFVLNSTRHLLKSLLNNVRWVYRTNQVRIKLTENGGT